MSEMRQNPITKKWVIYASSRHKRPYDFQSQGKEKNALPEVDSECPFCPGNEGMLPHIIIEMKAKNGRGWQTRIVPNKFAALNPYKYKDTLRSKEGIYPKMQGYGYHEVIIESPRHNADIINMSTKEVETIIETYYRRYIYLLQDKKIKSIFIFRNHGRGAGTSLLHPHSQLIATSVVPFNIRLIEKEAQSYFRKHNCCIFCDILKREQKEQKRIILENSSFLAFIPFAAEVPSEVWLFPKRHQSDFSFVIDIKISYLAGIIQEVLKLLYQKLNNPDYNLVINTFTHSGADDTHLHWFIQVRPRSTLQAGFEIGSGISINPSIPEEDSQFLRKS